MNFSPDQLEALEKLKQVYPRGIGTADPDVRVHFEALAARDSGMVRLVDHSDSPSGDAFVLSDEYANALREDAEERTQNARSN